MQTTLDGISGDTDDAIWKRAERALHPSCHGSMLMCSQRSLPDSPPSLCRGSYAEGEVPTERRYQRVLATPDYEAWVICWPSGGSLDLHDHGGSAGAFSVVSGELDEATIEVTADGNARGRSSVWRR